MAFYADQMFYTRSYGLTFIQTATFTLAGTGTAVTNSSAGIAAGSLPQFVRPLTAINKMNVGIVTAPVAGVTGGVLYGLNGTNTFATATIGTNTAGVYVTASINTAFNTFSSASGPTFQFVGTVTSAGTGAGQYAIYTEEQEQYSSSD